jgi:hypothetical protein
VTAETLAIAAVVLVGATVVGMVKQFFADPWDTQEGTVYYEIRAYQPVTAYQPVYVPAPQPQPQVVVTPLPPRSLPAPRPERVPEPALLAAD